MKIIHNALPDRNEPTQVKCHHCTSTLEVMPADIKRKRPGSHDGAHYQAPAYDFRCKACGRVFGQPQSMFKWILEER